MSSKNSGVPSPTSMARANRQRIAAEQGKQVIAEIQRQANAVRANMMRLRVLREAEAAKNVEANPTAADGHRIGPGTLAAEGFSTLPKMKAAWKIGPEPVRTSIAIERRRSN